MYALDHNVEGLAQDHANARHLAEELATIDGMDVPVPRSNMVFLHLDPDGFDAQEFCQQLSSHNVLMIPVDSHRVRAVTHLDVDREMIDQAILVVKDIFQRGSVKSEVRT